MKPVHVSAPSLPFPRVAARHPGLARLLWQWLAVGALLLIAVPAARGSHAWLGSGLFWLLLAPLSSLLAFHRDALAAAWRGILAPAPRRRLARAPGAVRQGFSPVVLAWRPHVQPRPHVRSPAVAAPRSPRRRQETA